MNNKNIIFLLVLFLFPFNNNLLCQPKYGWDHDNILNIIGLKEGMRIGEAGAGDGYLTFYLSKRVGDTGIVYANDISSWGLRKIQARYKREEITNIETVIGEIADPLFPAKNLDMVVMVHAFHDFSQPVKWLKNVRSYMKEDARLVIIDRDSERCTISYDKRHFMNEKQITDLIIEGGFEIMKIDRHLEQDNIYIAFQKKDNKKMAFKEEDHFFKVKGVFICTWSINHLLAASNEQQHRLPDLLNSL